MLTHGMRALVALGVGAFLVAGPHASTLPLEDPFGTTIVTASIETGFAAGIGLFVAGLGLLTIRRWRERLAGVALLIGSAGIVMAVPGDSPNTGTGLAPLLFLGPAVASAILATTDLRQPTRTALVIGTVAGVILGFSFGPLAGNGLPESLPLSVLLFATGAGLLAAATDQALGSADTEPQLTAGTVPATA